MSKVLAMISLFALRLGAPLLVTFVPGMLLSRWDSHRAEFFTR
jgi:hypothetical protein